MKQNKQHTWKSYSQLNAMNQVALCPDFTGITGEPKNIC